eukprot:COSAG01_NODE_469_length_16584_cov_10.725265_17_plen_237_part_00
MTTTPAKRQAAAAAQSASKKLKGQPAAAAQSASEGQHLNALDLLADTAAAAAAPQNIAPDAPQKTAAAAQQKTAAVDGPPRVDRHATSPSKQDKLSVPSLPTTGARAGIQQKTATPRRSTRSTNKLAGSSYSLSQPTAGAKDKTGTMSSKKRRYYHGLHKGKRSGHQNNANWFKKAKTAVGDLTVETCYPFFVGHGKATQKWNFRKKPCNNCTFVGSGPTMDQYVCLGHDKPVAVA